MAGDLVDAMLAAPVGATLLGRLEAEAQHQRGTLAAQSLPGMQYVILASVEADENVIPSQVSEPIAFPVPHEVAPDSQPGAVADAVARIADMSFGELASRIAEVGYMSAGPWSSSAHREVAFAFADAEARRPIAEAIAERFADELAAPLGTPQVWWHTNHGPDGWFGRTLFVDRNEHAYCCGEFTHMGLWTASDEPHEAHYWSASAWELDDDPISRWILPVNPKARVFEVQSPADWAQLVARFPRRTLRGHSVGRDGHPTLMPDWDAAAEEIDGVHLTWAGQLTADGVLTRLPTDGATLLRFWFTERTLWLNDVFGEPEPAAPPMFPDWDGAVDVRKDPGRRDRDRAVLRKMLQR